jgi:hypothetical protein
VTDTSHRSANVPTPRRPHPRHEKGVEIGFDSEGLSALGLDRDGCSLWRCFGGSPNPNPNPNPNPSAASAGAEGAREGDGASGARKGRRSWVRRNSSLEPSSNSTLYLHISIRGGNRLEKQRFWNFNVRAFVNERLSERLSV